MERADLPELHYIAPIVNVPSILLYGMLSKNEVKKQGRPYVSVAMEEIQDRRDGRNVRGGRPLHDYVNLYLCARNPMLSKLCNQMGSQGLCVLRVSADVLDSPGAIVTDGNAASDYVGFWPAPAGLKHVNKELVFAEWWKDPDRIQYLRKKTAKCAELLVPACVPSTLILGAYVSGSPAREALAAACPALSVAMDQHLFFWR